MGRSSRLVADGLVYHALNRGNNRAPVFFDAADYLYIAVVPVGERRFANALHLP